MIPFESVAVMLNVYIPVGVVFSVFNVADVPSTSLITPSLLTLK